MSEFLIRKIIISLILIVSFSLGARAEGRIFQPVPNADGAEVAQATVYDIKRADDGFIWIATDNGLLRFDGQHTVKIDIPVHDGAPESVKGIATFAGGGVLVGTPSGIFSVSIHDDEYKVAQLLDGKPFSATCGISTASGDAIIGGDSGLVIFSPQSGKTSEVKLSGDILNRSNNVVDLAQSPNAVYALTKGGIFRLDKLSRAVLPVNSEIDLSELSPTSLACSSDRLYIGTSGDGVLSLNPVDGKVESTPFVIKGNVVTSLDVSDDMRTLFIGTDGGGVTRVDLESGRMTNYRHRSSDSVSPSSNQVYSLLYDSKDLLWVGYYQHGVDYTPKSAGPFELYDNPLVFKSRGIPVRALCVDSAYNAIGTREGVIVHYKQRDEVWEVGAPQLRSEMVISLLAKDGKIFVGTYGGGLKVIDPALRNVYDFAAAKDEQVFRNGHVFSLASDGKGGLWAGTNDGLYQFDANGKVAHYTSYLTALPEGNVYGIFFDSEGKGWICTESGVCVYDPERKILRTDLFPVSFPKDVRFRSVYEDSRKRLYFVPEFGYVYSCELDFSNPRYLDYPLLKDSDAKSVVEDSFGDIWISTNRGIFRTDTTGHTVRFGLAAGLPSLSFLQAQPLHDSGNIIWFGNSDGLLRLNENAIESSLECQRPPVPTKVTVNGVVTDIVPLADDKSGNFHISLDRFSNNLKIGFSNFSYSMEEPDEYQYRLGDGEWLPLKKDMSVTIYDPMPGTQTLWVRYAGDSDNPDSKMTEVRLHIPYPISWKIGFSVIVVLILVIVWLAYRSIRHHRRLKQLPDIESQEQKVATPSEPEPVQQKKYVSNTLSRNEAREISAKIDEVMRREKPYLQSDLKVAQLAEMVGISSHKLSQFFSQHKDISFYDYVNKFRVDEFKRMVKEEEVKNLTLSAMAEKAGFSSRASFFRYFKSIEGISPGEYLKSRQN